jgi:hypothetical protein
MNFFILTFDKLGMSKFWCLQFEFRHFDIQQISCLQSELRHFEVRQISCLQSEFRHFDVRQISCLHFEFRHFDVRHIGLGQETSHRVTRGADNDCSDNPITSSADDDYCCEIDGGIAWMDGKVNVARRVTRKVCESVAQNVAQTISLSNLMHNF